MATHSSTHAWVIHGQRSLTGYSPWSCKKSDTTEQLNNNNKSKPPTPTSAAWQPGASHAPHPHPPN